MTLDTRHQQHLDGSAIKAEIVQARGYSTITTLDDLARRDGDLADYQRNIPAIGIPVYRLGTAKPYTLILRPDAPRATKNTEGKVKPIKYEWPAGKSLCIDILPRFRDSLLNTDIPIWFTEGAKKADALASLGKSIMPASLNGVWGWRSKNADGGSGVLSDFDQIKLKGREVVLAFDSDYAVNRHVQQALNALADFLATRGAIVGILQLPHGDAKMGVDDAIVAGWSYEQLCAAVTPAKPGKHSSAVLLAAHDLGYTPLRLNLCDDTIVSATGTMGDVHWSTLSTTLYDQGTQIGKERLIDVCMANAARDSYHPVRDYLDSLTWDGENHIAKLCACFESSDPPVVYQNGLRKPLHSVYLYRWLIGTVAKVYEQAQNLMLVLAGAQNLGKSSFVRYLGSPLPQYRTEGAIPVGDKDADIRLITSWIWEVSELDATTRKADVAALKDFITREVVTVRKPYGRGDIRKPALASLVGTVNDGDGFLADPTGNRRFLVTTITKIDWSYSKIDVNQLWAQAVVEYKRGKEWRLTPTEYQTQQVVNRAHEVTDPIEGWIERYFILGTAGDTVGMTTADIIDHLRTKEVPVNADRSWETRIGAVLRRRGITKRQVADDDGRRARRYYGIIPK